MQLQVSKELFELLEENDSTLNKFRLNSF